PAGDRLPGIVSANGRPLLREAQRDPTNAAAAAVADLRNVLRFMSTKSMPLGVGRTDSGAVSYPAARLSVPRGIRAVGSVAGTRGQWPGTFTYERSRSATEAQPRSCSVLSRSARRISSARATPASPAAARP